MVVVAAVVCVVCGLWFTRKSNSPEQHFRASYLERGDGKGWNDDDDEDQSDRARGVWHAEFFARIVNVPALAAAYPAFAAVQRTPRELARAARAATHVADALDHVGVRFWLSHQTLPVYSAHAHLLTVEDTGFNAWPVHGFLSRRSLNTVTLTPYTPRNLQ